MKITRFSVWFYDGIYEVARGLVNAHYSGNMDEVVKNPIFRDTLYWFVKSLPTDNRIPHSIESLENSINALVIANPRCDKSAIEALKTALHVVDIGK